MASKPFIRPALALAAALERVEHLQWLARLRALFEWTALTRERTEYRRLLACEEHAL